MKPTFFKRHTAAALALTATASLAFLGCGSGHEYAQGGNSVV
jgi:hypothetical protein